MTVEQGMDVERVQAIARALTSLAARAGDAHQTGSALAGVLGQVWAGADLNSFQEEWRVAGPQLADAAGALRSAGEELHRQAGEQEGASRGEGGHGLPGLDLPDFDFPDVDPYAGFDWVPQLTWPPIDLAGLWDGFVDILEKIGDWWDDLPVWVQILAGVVGVVIGIVVAVFLGLEVLAVIGTILAIVGAVMTVLDLLDTIAEILRDPAAWWEKVKNMSPLELLDELVWFAVGLIPWGLGKLLKRFRKPLRELLERLSPTLRTKLDDLVDRARRAGDDLRRKFDELVDKITARRNKRDLDGGLSAHEGPGKGHTLGKHVGKTDQELIDRATPSKGKTPPKDGVSTYPTVARAERATADAINTPRSQQAIDDWLKDPSNGGPLELKEHMGYTTGRHVPAGGTSASDVTGVRVVLIKDPSMPSG